ncbi:hypothetical protein AWH48_03125 [Domibacillus aminovorans]|uniref:Uncharacterized protein n=1 Tax=Domibacillus aminovorans TaxID=29332 RepID=A0A177KZM9_9BACI|nr:hypothetical protein [Domibacillus aminovorans]OAH58011.1 hypothetical protein AWH48_03125 [Domibacillus aminovorans]
MMMYLKWRDFGGRMIIITESLNHLSTLELSEGLKVRAALEEELRNSCRGELFYSRISEGNWVKEAENSILNVNEKLYS